MNTNPPATQQQEEPKPDPERRMIATVVVELVAERFGHVYGSRPGKEAEDAFLQWILESEYAKSVDNDALRSDGANLLKFKTTLPDEWRKRKAWLNRPGKGSRLLKAFVAITHEAKRVSEKLAAAAVKVRTCEESGCKVRIDKHEPWAKAVVDHRCGRTA